MKMENGWMVSCCIYPYFNTISFRTEDLFVASSILINVPTKKLVDVMY